jgi:hypothetical protein
MPALVVDVSSISVSVPASRTVNVVLPTSVAMVRAGRRPVLRSYVRIHYASVMSARKVICVSSHRR